MLLIACTSGDGRTADAPVADTVAAVPDTPAAAPDTATPAAEDGAWVAGDTSVRRDFPGATLLASVRTARHDGFDRIVLDFGDSPLPSYRIGYVDEPVRQCGSGEEVELAGSARLSVTLSPANAHTEAGEPTVREREQAPGLPVLLELKIICDFEAQVEVVAGVVAPNEYRVMELESPNRLVIDIRH